MDRETVDKLLTTTRSVRKRLDFDRPVEREVILQCLDLAVQAPRGTNRQAWHFLVVMDAEKRAQIGDYYRQSFEHYVATPGSSFHKPDDTQIERVRDSSRYLAENMHRVPVLIIPCYKGRVENAPPMRQASVYGSILPAAWSLMLALRSRGLGAAWTTIHLRYEREIAALLSIPDDVTQGVLLPVAYYKGEDFGRAKRSPVAEVTSWDLWGNTQVR
jgi:nitroreductase